ncbi:hypothetical protein KAOT1_20837 [Kordia algicida OT-1]|uniref:Uncharacterized protein n=2 Tax=Kordia TaxID=221065 RepID=A9DM83_9FLAO|nr:hypothetical protein KAOT1_20837 [Kordia algicida OT-1]
MYLFCMAPTATGIIPDETVSWQKKIAIILLVPLVISIFLAPLLYWLTPKLQLRHRRKKTKKKLFQEFVEKNAFRISDDGHVLGKIDNYIVIIHANYNEFQSTKWIETQILFHPKQGNQYISQSFFQRMIRKYEGKNVTWFANSILIKSDYILKLPKYEVLYPLIKRCISELKAQNITPISHKQWTALIPETQQYLNNIEKL